MNPPDQNQAFGNPFNVPYHLHNGADAPQVPFVNLNNYQNYVASSKITLTSTQIQALNSTPVIILPGPVLSTGTNIRTVTIVLGITAYLSYVSADYTGGNNLEFRYTNASGIKVTADIPNTFINSSSSGYYYAPAVTSAFVPVSNTPIIVRVPTANPAAGNSTITFVVHYRLISF